MEEIKRCIREVGLIINKTVGVVNRIGTIMASTDHDLIGQEDTVVGGMLVSDEAKHVSDNCVYARFVDIDDTPYFVFVKGTDEVAKSYSTLVANWIQSAIRERNTDAERVAFIKNVLLENELPGDIPLKAREFKLAYAAPRVVFLIRVAQSEGQGCLAILQNLFPDKKTHYILAMDEENLVLVAELDHDFDEVVESTSKMILDNLNTESMSKVYIGIGMTGHTLRDIAKSYREATMALRVGSIFENDQYLMRYDKLGLGRLIYQLPPTLCNMFLDEVFEKGAYESLDTETLVTIDKFFENNLNGSETSRKLFVHRNTLVYRLDKVQKITGLDLRIFDDAVLFKLASMVRTYLEKQDKEGRPSMYRW